MLGTPPPPMLKRLDLRGGGGGSKATFLGESVLSIAPNDKGNFW